MSAGGVVAALPSTDGDIQTHTGILFWHWRPRMGVTNLQRSVPRPVTSLYYYGTDATHFLHFFCTLGRVTNHSLPFIPV